MPQPIQAPMAFSHLLFQMVLSLLPIGQIRAMYYFLLLVMILLTLTEHLAKLKIQVILYLPMLLKQKVVMLNAAPTINHVAAFTAADGTIGDGGVLGTAAAKAASNNALSTVASTAGSGFTIGDVVTAADAGWHHF